MAKAAAIATYHSDNWRTGWNQQETVLTPANVGNLQLLTQVSLDAQIDAQPLIVPGVTIAGGQHDIVYVATENDTVYALDAATGAILLQQNFGTPVPQSALPGQCTNNSNIVGINSTPVIDLTSNTLYVMIYAYENNNQVYRLHALDLATLQDKATPAVVQATATLSDGSIWNFEPAYNRQRNALLEANGNIYVGFGSFCDNNANISRGWLLGWKAGSLVALKANRLNNRLIPVQSPDDFFLSSIWASGYGVAADAGGNLYFVTGNSDYSGTTYNTTYNLSESVVKMSADLKRVLTYFSPSGSLGVSYLDQTDNDFGSGGVLVIPQQLKHTVLATAAGKVGQMYLLDTSHTNQVLGTYSIGGCWCGESYFQGWDGVGRVVSSGGSQIIIWRLQTSPSVALVEESSSQLLPTSAQDPGFFTSISSNGGSNAIVWAVGRPVNSSPAYVTLYAFGPQAAAAGNNGWLFSAVAGAWPNTGGNANIVPVVANGRVYVASDKELAIFGLAQAGAVTAATSIYDVPIAPMALPPLPPGGHEIFGTIKSVNDGNITLASRTGELVRVDAADAMRRHMSIVLLSGEPVTIFGKYDATGVLHATSVQHAKPSPKGWSADR